MLVKIIWHFSLNPDSNPIVDVPLSSEGVYVVYIEVEP